MAGIDFMAIARGRQLARKENRQDRVWAQEDLKRELERETWQDELRDIKYNREAMAYVAPLITHLQTAQAAGLSPVDYLLQQRDQIMADPAFLAFSPEVQNRVLSTLGQSMRVTAQDLQQTGRFDDAQRLTEGFNVVSPVTGIDQARAAGSPQQALDFLNSQYGSEYFIDENGMVNVEGTLVPADQVAMAVFSSGGQGAGALAAGIQQRQVNEQRDRNDMALRMAGFNPDGTKIVQPTQAQLMGTPTSANPLGAYVSTQGGMPGQNMSVPGQANWRAQLPGVQPQPSPYGLETAGVQTPIGVQGPGPEQALINPPVLPAGPDGNRPKGLQLLLQMLGSPAVVR